MSDALNNTIPDSQPLSFMTAGDLRRLIADELRSISESKQSTPVHAVIPVETEKKVMTVDEAAAYTGYTSIYIYKLAHRREIPYHKRGGRLFFVKKELTEWMLSHRVPTKEETERTATTYVMKYKNHQTKTNHDKARI